jgi:hypothetical protein
MGGIKARAGEVELCAGEFNNLAWGNLSILAQRKWLIF